MWIVLIISNISTIKMSSSIKLIDLIKYIVKNIFNRNLIILIPMIPCLFGSLRDIQGRADDK